MAELAQNVNVDGVWYGPAYGNAADVPADAAQQVTSPAAWVDGKAPKGVTLDDPAPERLSPAVDIAAAQSGDDAEVEALRVEYREVTGKAPDKRWKAERLRDEITAARGEG